MKSTRKLLLALLASTVLAGCGTDHQHDSESEHEHSHGATEGDSWAVTAWGDRFEIFAETGGLEVGRSSIAFTHVTILESFAPLEEGTVSVILRDAGGSEKTFSVSEATRAGIFSVPVEPQTSGEFDLMFRISTNGSSEDVAAGRVRVGDSGSPGGLVEPAPMTIEAVTAVGQLPGGSEISFLKEQQWRTDFSTSWLSPGGSLSDSVRGPGRVRPTAGGEILLSSPVDGVISGTPWPYPGHAVRRAAAVFQVMPRVASDRSLAELEADVEALEAEHEAARQRLDRLDGLLELGATSRREIEEAQALEAALASRLGAARRNLATASAGRRGAATSVESVSVKAPFSGRVARIDTTPGQVVAAGAPLGLLVRESPLWIEVALRPDEATGLQDPAGLDLRSPNQSEPLTFRGDTFRLVSLSPAVDPQTGTISALFEVAAGVDQLPIGAPVEAEILLAGERLGTVVPESALVDDGGVAVVYLQTEGESFVRAEVTIVARQSGRALVEGLREGARYVERGGNAIRRATLVSQGAGEGHIH
jgi:RND family efflux transporter MFP subunit